METDDVVELVLAFTEHNAGAVIVIAVPRPRGSSRKQFHQAQAHGHEDAVACLVHVRFGRPHDVEWLTPRVNRSC